MKTSGPKTRIRVASATAARLARALALALLATLLFTPPARASDPGELFNLANEARSAAGVQPLLWDKALAAAAYDHALRMAATSSISHRYQGELDLAERTSAAGAQFSLIEENVAVASTAAQIHQGWMRSQGHRENLLDPGINRVGIAVVAAHGMLFAVADYSRLTPSLTQPQVESGVARLLRLQGVSLMTDPTEARRYCASTAGGLSSATGDSGEMARFGMRWQAADLSALPQSLEERIATGRFRRASVGACSPMESGTKARSPFSSYRVAVILY